jgi:hypothetical protein
LLAVACSEGAERDSNETVEGASGATGQPSAAGAPADDSGDAAVRSYLWGADSFSPFVTPDVAGEGGAAPELPLGPPYGIDEGCGDAIVGLTEECDDGAGGADGCTSSCKTRDQATGPGPTMGQPSSSDRYLGAGRHPLSGLDQGFVTTYVQAGGEEPAIGATLFDIWGKPKHFITVSEGASPIYEANPVAAALPDGRYAVAWGDFDGDGSDLGVALRAVAADGELGTLRAANGRGEFSQLNPDVIWTGQQLIVAWEDYADALNGPDLRYRIFDQNLNSLSGDLSLAAGELPEAAVALTTFNGSWAAAYREGAADGAENLVVKVGDDAFRVGPVQGGPLDDRPALLELDATHLLLVFSAGTSPSATGLYDVPRLFHAVIDTEGTATPAFAALDPLDRVFTAENQTAQLSPALARSGQGVYVAWRSEARPGDAAGDQIWLKFLRWQDGSAPRLDLEEAELLVPRTCDGSAGDQRRPALANTALPPGGALAIAWEDYGHTSSAASGEPDVLVHYAPTHLAASGEPPRVVTETWSGPTGAPWPAQWSSNVTGPVSLTTQSNEGEFNAFSLPGSMHAWINDHTAENVDLVTTVRFTSYVHFGGMFVRRADDDSDTFLWVSFSTRRPQPWTLNAVLDGTPIQLASFTLPYSFSTVGYGVMIDFRLRFRVLTNPDGSMLIGMRIWRVGGVEPTTWLMSDTLPTTSPVVQRLGGIAGRFGILARIDSANGGKFYYDDFEATFFEGNGTGELNAEAALPLRLRRDTATYRTCTADTPCAEGAGCCERAADCAEGLVCTPQHAAAFGQGSHASVCTLDHCANLQLDADRGETRADCGGAECPTCECTSTLTKGTVGYCSPPCLCGIGDYPCAKNAGCLPGLLCGTDAGEPFGAPFGTDACVPAHCMNRVLDTESGETAPDCGGPCGEDCDVCDEPNGEAGHCRVYCPCALGEGFCRDDDECAPGLICSGIYGRGSRYGLATGTNVCVPAHCANNKKDTDLGETAIDCGNECGCLGPCLGAPCPP